MKLTITEKHLDAALARPWSTRTCLVAQAIAEYAGEPVKLCGHGTTDTESDRRFNWLEFDGISREYDKAFWHTVTKEESEKIIANLRAKLPLTIEVEEIV